MDAENCEDVDRCSRLFNADDQLELRPECGSEPTDHCEGNIAKYCITDDDVTWYEFSYDCTMAGATCIEGVDANGVPWSDCQAPLEPCDGHETSYCDGTRAVVCDETFLGGQRSGRRSPWIFDCADAFDSTCVAIGARVACEGPAVGEAQCDDGLDNDEDGEADCADSECTCGE